MSQTAAATAALMLASVMPLEAEAAAQFEGDEAPVVSADSDGAAHAETIYADSASPAGRTTFASEWRTPSLPVSFNGITLKGDGYAPVIRRALGFADIMGSGAAALTNASRLEPDGPIGYEQADAWTPGMALGYLGGMGFLILFSGAAFLFYRISNGKGKGMSEAETTPVAADYRGRARLRPEDAVRVAMESKQTSVRPPEGPATYGKKGNH